MKHTRDAEFHGWRPQRFFADQFKVGEATVRRWFLQAGLRSRRVGIQTFYREEDVREWIETGRAPRQPLARAMHS